LTEVKGGSVEAIYHWHPHYVDALGVRMRASDTHFFLQDANFNVTAAVNDDGNAVDERYSYTPYGEPTVLDADFTADSVNDDGYSDIDNRHLYTGREFDWDSGLQLNRHRYYASHLGRWLTRDPIGYDADDLNLYNYVGGSPVHHIDPMGLDPWGRPWGSENAYWNRCCKGKYYNGYTHCCENGQIVAKVPIWICERPLDLPPSLVGITRYYGWWHEWWLPQDFHLSHSYICCDGPNLNCFGKQSTTKVGEAIPVEMLCTGECETKMVCPAERSGKCNNPISNKPYSIPGCKSCHDWAHRPQLESL
jgi:RHS repeat-associated protein